MVTLDTKEPMCELFFTPEELDGEFEPENIGNYPGSSTLYSLQRETFFAYAPGETMNDWNRYVESDPELVEARKTFLIA